MEWFNSQLFELVIALINGLCLLFCFSKMGIDPWAAIIPVYCQWCLFDRIWGRGGLMLLIYIAGIIFFPTISSILMAATYWRVFAGFGKGPMFCAFGVFFQPIAIAICALDGSRYYS